MTSFDDIRSLTTHVSVQLCVRHRFCAHAAGNVTAAFLYITGPLAHACLAVFSFAFVALLNDYSTLFADMESFRPGTAATTATKVELAVECQDLIDADILSKSDPMCVLFAKEFTSDRYTEIGRSETIQNNLNPKFVKRFVLDYFFEERQMLRFEL